MAWYKRNKDDDTSSEKRSVPAGVFTKCPGCRETLLTADLHLNLDVCSKCDHHFVVGTRERVRMIIDEGTFEELDSRIESIDPLGFRDSKRYADRVRAARRQAGTSDALISGAGAIEGHPVEAGFFVFEFMGGSMGSVVGEKVTRVFYI
jgi:acetyl-CoA carboxylase carboxyl transferase subunit beta